MSQLPKEVNELKTLGRASAAVAFMLWGVFPIHVLGWLVSAVARNPAADQAIRSEPVYAFMLFWQGGANSLPITTLLMPFLALLIGLEYWFRSAGFSEPTDGMKTGRVLLRKLIIPAFLSAAAFSAGVMSQGTLKTLFASTTLLIIFALFAAMIHYFADTTE